MTMKKKVLFLTMVILLFVGLASAKTAFTPISPDDLKDLKGEWTGERRDQRGVNARADLRIYNDRLPLEGEVVLYFPRVAPKTWQFDNGQIEDGSLLVIWSDGRKMKLGLRKGDGKMELEGDIQSSGFAAKVFFKKVK
jgi:hypothetical protein